MPNIGNEHYNLQNVEIIIMFSSKRDTITQLAFHFT